MRGRIYWVTGYVLTLALLLMLGGLAAPRRVPRAVPHPDAGITTPAALLPAINTTLGASDDAYAVTPAADIPATVRARNPAQQLTAVFGPDGVRLGGMWGMSFVALGYGDTLAPVPSTAPVAVGNRVEYRRGDVTEWYVNGPVGLEQGFTLAASPAGGHGADLTLAIAVPGATVTPAEDGLRIVPRDGGDALRYGHLTVQDATGRALPARLVTAGGAIRIVVDDREAVYPLVVDPLAQSAKLTGTGEVGQANFGGAVALSGDGTIALVSAPSENGGDGAVYVFVRSGTTWIQQGSKLTGNSGFAFSMALNADGTTALIGARSEDASVGAAYVFTRSGTTWSQQQRLTGSGEVGSGEFGWSVALSEDGTTALIGARGEDTAVGAAYVFTRSGTTWSQQQRLTGTGEVGGGEFGSAVALSGDGTTALIGADADNSTVGSAFVFTRSGTTWSQQQRLTGSGETGNGGFGSAVALSGDGNTALIGAYFDNSFVGAAFVFTRSGTTWSQQGSKLTGTGETGSGEFGSAAALSRDGATALISAPNDNNAVGAAFMFVRSGTTWSQQGSKLIGSGETGNGSFGSVVALSGDGATAFVGTPGDNLNVGAVFVFSLRYMVTPLPGATPQSATIGTAVATPLAVRVVDPANGQAITGASVTFTATSGGASGTFAGGMTTTTAMTDASGVATAPTFTANATAGNYVVTATTVEGSGAVFQLTNTPTSAAHVTTAFGSDQSATVGGAFSTSLVALVQDASGNGIAGIAVTFAAPGSGAGGTFTGSATVMTNSNGYATAPAFTANTTAGAYIVTATATGIAAPATFALTNTPGAVASLAVAGFPSSTVAGVAHTFTVTAKDASGNTVTGYTSTVHVTSSDAAATLPANYTFAAGDNGMHTFTATLNTVGSNRSIAVTDSGNSVNGTQSGIAVTPAVLSVSPLGGPQAGGGTVTITGIGFTMPLSVTIGGAACTNVQVNGTGTSLTCTAPTNQPAGTVDVAVMTPNGTGTLTHGYTFLPVSVAPAPGGRSGSGAGGAGGGGNAPAAQPSSR